VFGQVKDRAGMIRSLCLTCRRERVSQPPPPDQPLPMIDKFMLFQCQICLAQLHPERSKPLGRALVRYSAEGRPGARLNQTGHRLLVLRLAQRGDHSRRLS
jgi:hypothetical protein